MTEAKKLVAKLAEVMAEVNRLPKTGFNERQGYYYVTESDVMDCIRANLAQRGVIIDHDVTHCTSEWRDSRSGGAIQFTTVCMEFTARDSEGNELKLGRSWGQGQDSGEKAVYKAITGATKYKLLKTFFMSSGNDPEADASPDIVSPPPAGGQSRPVPPAPQQQRQAPAPQRQSSGPLPDTFPNFGKSKGAPIRGASTQDLEYYANAARRSLADPSKARFHDKERANLAAYTAEVRRQATGTQQEPPDDGPPPPGDDDAPF